MLFKVHYHESKVLHRQLQYICSCCVRAHVLPWACLELSNDCVMLGVNAKQVCGSNAAWSHLSFCLHTRITPSLSLCAPVWVLSQQKPKELGWGSSAHCCRVGPGRKGGGETGEGWERCALRLKFGINMWPFQSKVYSVSYLEDSSSACPGCNDFVLITVVPSAALVSVLVPGWKLTPCELLAGS